MHKLFSTLTSVCSKSSNRLSSSVESIKARAEKKIAVIGKLGLDDLDSIVSTALSSEMPKLSKKFKQAALDDLMHTYVTSRIKDSIKRKARYAARIDPEEKIATIKSTSGSSFLTKFRNITDSEAHQLYAADLNRAQSLSVAAQNFYQQLFYNRKLAGKSSKKKRP